MDQVLGIDYEFCPDIEQGTSIPIKIITPDSPYNGIIYHYGKVACDNIDEDGNGVVQFEFKILSDHDEATYQDDAVLHQKLGEILTSIIYSSLNLGEESEIGTNDPEGTIQQ